MWGGSFQMQHSIYIITALIIYIIQTMLLFYFDILTFPV